MVLTCTECLRSFPLSVATEDLQKIRETPCLFCPNTVRYIIDCSLSIASPRPEVEAETIVGNSSHELYCAKAQTCPSRVRAGPVKTAAKV